jgi:cation transport regulator ChaB
MPYASNAELPDAVKDALPQAQARGIWRNTFNSQQERGLSEERCFASAWAAVKRSYRQDSAGKWHPIEKVLKFDTERQYVFGWASVAITKDGQQVEDLQGDLIDVEDLEEAAYAFALEFGDTGAMHTGEAIGKMIESFIVTPDKLEAMGLAPDALPQGWWVGFHVNDAQVFGKIKKGDYQGFSIQGSAIREPIEDEVSR